MPIFAKRAPPARHSRRMITYDFHPEVRRDLDEIWDIIAVDNPEAAGWLIAEIIDAIDALSLSPVLATSAPTSPDGPYASFRCVNI